MKKRKSYIIYEMVELTKIVLYEKYGIIFKNDDEETEPIIFGECDYRYAKRFLYDKNIFNDVLRMLDSSMETFKNIDKTELYNAIQEKNLEKPYEEYNPVSYSEFKDSSENNCKVLA